MSVKPPFFDYDDRYFLESKHTREELYKLQEIIYKTMKKYPTTFRDELNKLDYDQKEIDTILSVAQGNKINKN